MMPGNLKVGAILGYAVLALFIFVSLLPLWVALKTAMSYPQDIFQSTTSLLPPRATLGNFQRAAGLPSDIVLTSVNASPINFVLALRNSVIYTSLVVTGQLFFSSMAA